MTPIDELHIIPFIKIHDIMIIIIASVAMLFSCCIIHYNFTIIYMSNKREKIVLLIRMMMKLTSLSLHHQCSSSDEVKVLVDAVKEEANTLCKGKLHNQ